ncbi:MAG: sigma 54-interacting transcriptional regulator [Planctomycetes bacterium]|nr:sigma 54-interacting transcriptional regulator [Planctomycetota bacterium]
MTPATFPLPAGAVADLRRLHSEPDRIAAGLAQATVDRLLDLARLLSGGAKACLTLSGAPAPWGDVELLTDGRGETLTLALEVPLLPDGLGSARVFGSLILAPGSTSPPDATLKRHAATILIVDALARAAEADPLTGLLTRAAFERALATITERIGAEQIAVLMLDVDDLGTLNAARGYRGGDDLLRTLGAAASSEAALGLACRYGGDELALVLPGAGEEEVRAVASRLRAVVESCRAGSCRPSLSAGIARGPEDGETAEELIYRADQALARAKSEGKGLTIQWEPYLQRQRRRDRLAGILTGDPARDYRNVQALLESVQAVSRLGPLEETLAEIVVRAIEIAGADRGLLLLREDEVWSARVARLANGEATSGEAFATSVADAALAEGRPISRVAEGVETISMSAQALGLKAVLCAPLLGEDVPTGVLYVDAAATPGRFDAPTVAFLGALGAEVATALRNASLYERLVARTEQLEADVSDREQSLVRLREGWARFQGVASADGYEGLVGRSQAMRDVFAQLESLEGTAVSVLIEGESGTGKELVARALHARSARREAPLVAINCAAIPSSLFESELFGHVKGAFTGADTERRGLLEAADGGTLFLDEVGELPPEAQAKLLRVLQEKEIRRVGETQARKVDLRVISATNRCLRTAADEGSFREDLYYRLAVFRVLLPPLRDRPADLPLLIEHLLTEQRERGVSVGSLTPAALEALAGRRWRGNVRELRNALERAGALALGGALLPEHFEPEPTGAQPEIGFAALVALPFHDAKAAFGLHYVRALIEQEGSIPAAAKAAGVSRQTFYRLLNRAEDSPS